MTRNISVKEVHKLAKVPKGADKVLFSWNRFKEFLLRNYKRTHFKVSLVRGEYDYYHYLCDGTDDRGWGCGYRYNHLEAQHICSSKYLHKLQNKEHELDIFTRTLQTMLSWLNMKQGKGNVPSIRAIQECLVNVGELSQNYNWVPCITHLKVGDKPANFVGSRDWIGSVEVSITIDSLCDVPCRCCELSQYSLIPLLKDSSCKIRRAFLCLWPDLAAFHKHRLIEQSCSCR